MSIFFVLAFLLTIAVFIATLINLVAIYIFITSCFMKHPPLVTCPPKVRKKIIEMLSSRIKESEQKDPNKNLKILDAGSGIGTLIVPLAKKHPNHHFIGVERSFLPYYISKYRARKMDNVTVHKMNMFDYSFADIDIVICFLMTSIMPKFSQKCKNELKKNSLVFSSRFELTDAKPIETIDLGNNFDYIHVYEC